MVESHIRRNGTDDRGVGRRNQTVCSLSRVGRLKERKHITKLVPIYYVRYLG